MNVPKQSATAYIGLGGNLGDRIAALRRALEELTALDGITLEQVASLYESSPVGGPPGQGDYLNTVARITTSLSPYDLLRQMQAIETSMGRHRAERWGSRLIDLDLLCYAGQIIHTQAPDDDPQSPNSPEPRASARANVGDDGRSGITKDNAAQSSSSVANTPALTLPHPRMHQRLFVLEPLSEITPDWVHPVLEKDAATLLRQCRTDHPEQATAKLTVSDWFHVDVEVVDRTM